jgi:endonuclease YncB( thermonuclease family)
MKITYSWKNILWGVGIFFVLIMVISGDKLTKTENSELSLEEQIQNIKNRRIIDNIVVNKQSDVEAGEEYGKTEEEYVLDQTVNTETPASADTYYIVLKVVDGDTLTIDKNGIPETLRLIGIDTPEVVDPRTPVQCFGQEASAKAKEILFGKKVRIESDPTQGERDKYGRLLVYVYLESGLFFNEYMIEEGYAHEYTYNVPYQYKKEFDSAEVHARTYEKGLWSPDTCNGDTETSVEESKEGGKFYTSSHSSAKYYYPEWCTEWQGLSSSYLKEFSTLEELTEQYNRTLSPQCR